MNSIQAFLEQCTKAPHNLAFYENEQSLDYLGFKQKVDVISAFLQSKAIQQHCIATALERGITSASCIYAILGAGGIYLPLDLKNPATRLNFIINDAQPRYILGQGSAPAWLENKTLWIDIDTFKPINVPISYIKAQDSDLAAVLYTSGSTGNPKGVALSHQALINFSQWAKNNFNLNAEDRIASLAPFHFDLSIFDLFSSLSAGASVYFVPNNLSLAPSRLTTWISEHKISTWYTVPSLLSFLALKGNLAKTDLSHFKRLLFAGEVFPTEQLIKLADLLPQTQLYNLYGPTETNVCCYWQVDRETLQAKQAIPIGKAACNAQLSLNAATGELQVNSLNNFSGYWQQGKLLKPADTPYATGDKVSINTQGEYLYHGRLDRMLKCSGYRVEPAEIEQCINQLEQVQQCAVIGIKDTTSGQRPAAVVVLKPEASLGEAIKPLRQMLAPYMQPCKFICVEHLPILSNGKIDYPSIEALFKP